MKDAQFIENLVEAFIIFSLFPGLKPNITKCKIAGIGAMKGVQMAVFGMKCIYLCNEVIKILGTCFPDNSQMKKNVTSLKSFPVYKVY